MRKTDLIKHIENKVFKDKLWAKGKTFSLVDENDKVFEAEEYGSYVDCQPKTGVEEIKIYNEYDTFLGKDEGSRAKQFFRIESSCFKELIEEKKNNPNCSYVTCIDDLIKDDYVPEKISAIMMRHNPAFMLYEDVESFAGRVLNHFEVPTMFCKKLRYHLSKAKKQDFIVAVDFIKPNEIMMNICDYIGTYINKSKASIRTRCFSEVISAYEMVYKAHYNKVIEEGFKLEDNFNLQAELDKMREQVAYMCLVRMYAMSDSDLMARNLGVIINQQTNKISIGPAFDFEFVCDYNFNIGKRIKDEFKNCKKSNMEPKYFLEEYAKKSGDRIGAEFISDIKEISKAHPQAINKFVYKINELLQGCDENESLLDKFFSQAEFSENFYGQSYKNALAQKECLEDKEREDDIKDYFKLVRDVCEVFANESQAEMSE